LGVWGKWWSSVQSQNFLQLLIDQQQQIGWLIHCVFISFNSSIRTTAFQELMLLGNKKTTPAIASAMPNLIPGIIFVVAACFRYLPKHTLTDRPLKIPFFFETKGH
jgi:hypothetical protein